MTERLYYTDSYLFDFDALVVGCEAPAGRPEVVLDKTAFYPSSGGQPHDTGRLGAARVVDVVDREDGTIVHVVDRPLEIGVTVRGEVDRQRRIDHLQQHTGQHLLSAAFERDAGVATVGFHLGGETSTIDLAREVTAGEVAAAEAEANRVVWQDRPVTVRFVTAVEAASLPLRKPPAREGTLRLVDVSDFDLSACGGTHARRTGEVGGIVVIGTERLRGGTRVGFACGARALAAFGRLRDATAAMARQLSVGVDELPGTVARLQDEARSRARLIGRLQEEVAGQRARDLRASAETIGAARVVLTHEPDWDAKALRTLALAVVSEPGLVVVLVGGGEPAPVVVARSDDVGFDAGAWMKAETGARGGRGGGRSDLGQGGVKAVAATILDDARTALIKDLG